jgi:ketosteroid isomerase-like protein
MGDDRIELIRAAFAAVTRGDTAAFAALLDPSFELVEQFEVSTSPGIHRGPERALSWYREGGRQWSSYVAELLDVQAVGERLVAEGEVRAKGRASGFEADRRFGYLFEFRGGKISRLEIWPCLDEARRAAER